jgi:lipopolysaccharide transport system permease protein
MDEFWFSKCIGTVGERAKPYQDTNFEMISRDEDGVQILEIKPTRGWVSLKLQELWDYRELLYFLTWRDIKVRYKQTELGILWALIQPVLTMLIFSVIFGKLARVPSDGVPYPVFAFTALVPWMFFANGLSHSSNSLVGSARIITKVYFPRLTIPISAILSGAFDFALSFIALLAMIAYYGMHPGWMVVYLPAFMLLAVVAAMGVGLWLSALNVKYRDVYFVIPFLVQFWMFATPIAYPSSLLPQPWRTLSGLNPMSGVVEGFRWALLGAQSGPSPLIIVSSLTSIALLISGMLYFRRVERTFADIV